MPGIHLLAVRNAAEAIAAAAAFDGRHGWRESAGRMTTAAAELRTLRVVDDADAAAGWLVLDREGQPLARGERGAGVVLDALAGWGSSSSC